MVVPPAFSTLSAATEVLVTVAVVWFFYRGRWHGDYRFGLMTVALVYETLFNISYMVYRIVDHEEGVTHTHPDWVTAFVAFHGTLSLGMFIGLIALVVWTYRQVRAGVTNPLAARGRLTYTFLALWMASILSGELIYLFYWLDVIGPGSS